MKRPLLEKNNDTFIRHNDAIAILRKIQKNKENSFADLVHSAMTFGFRTFFKEFDRTSTAHGYVKVFANKSQGYIKQSKIERGLEFLNKWKVYIPEAIGIGDMQKDILKPILGEPNTICTETYVMNGPYGSEEHARNAISYIRTKFFHFLVGLKKITQHTTQRVYQFVPLQDFSKPWTDAELYAKYGLTGEEIAFIESMIRPMDLEGGEQDA